MTDPRFNIEFAPHTYNDTLLQSYADKIEPKRRRERLLPPMPGWNPSGAVKYSIEHFYIILYSTYFIFLGR